MAEALLRRMFDEAGIDAEVRSVGTHAVEGVPAHPHSIEVAREAGLDLDRFRARRITPERVRWADTVLGMQDAHVRRAVEMDETVEAHVLTEFAPSSRDSTRHGIEDPIGRDRSVYVRVLDDIRSCLEEFVDRMRPTNAREPSSPRG